MVDDDMDMSALTKMNYIKSIVTSECQMDVERKGIQSYQSLLYVRLNIYKSRDTSGKLFRGDKSYLGDKSLRIYGDSAAESKIFIEFLALIIRNKM